MEKLTEQKIKFLEENMKTYTIRAIFTGEKEEYIYDLFLNLLENLRTEPTQTSYESIFTEEGLRGFVEIETTDEVDAVNTILTIPDAIIV
jgi:hypothetical protein